MVSSSDDNTIIQEKMIGVIDSLIHDAKEDRVLRYALRTSVGNDGNVRVGDYTINANNTFTITGPDDFKLSGIYRNDIAFAICNLLSDGMHYTNQKITSLISFDGDFGRAMNDASLLQERLRNRYDDMLQAQYDRAIQRMEKAQHQIDISINS